MKKLLLFVFSLLVFVPVVSAHVVVKPSEVGIGAWQTFSISVPVEKDIATVGVRLVVPEGVESVTPNVKTGWKISTKKNGEQVSEISWTGGVIPSGQRDEFAFSVHVPTKTTTLTWKAYQTYQDGSVASWDMDPALIKEGDDDSAASGPFSVTKVVDDLTTQPVAQRQDDSREPVLPIVAIGMSALALGLQLFSKKNS